MYDVADFEGFEGGEAEKDVKKSSFTRKSKQCLSGNNFIDACTVLKT
jgi:hypothetical protein